MGRILHQNYSLGNHNCSQSLLFLNCLQDGVTVDFQLNVEISRCYQKYYSSNFNSILIVNITQIHKESNHESISITDFSNLSFTICSLFQICARLSHSTEAALIKELETQGNADADYKKRQVVRQHHRRI